MILTDYFYYNDKTSIIEQLEQLKCEWRAIPYLLLLLKEETFHKHLGNGKLILLLDDKNLSDEKPTLVSFASFCDRDEIDVPLCPWIGFVFTAPSYRGNHFMGQIINYCMELAFSDYPESEYVYVSTDETGLYEKYGFTFFQKMQTVLNEDTNVYRRKIKNLK